MAMTNDEFNRCKLKKRLDFRMSEAARFVLVLGGSIDDAAELYCMNKKNDRDNVLAAIKLFEEYLKSPD